MTHFPINYQYSRDGAMDDGFASTSDEALDKIRAMMTDAGFEDDDLPTFAELTTTESGFVYRNRADAERAYAAEIDAGYCRISQVYGGYKAMIETFTAMNTPIRR